jgi:hypothetical protein
VKSPNLKLRATRTFEIDGLFAGLSELLADYKTLATGTDGNVSPVCTECIKKVQAISPGDLAEWFAFLENNVGAREDVIEKMRAFMLDVPITNDLDALFEHVDKHKEEIEERIRLNRTDWWNSVVASLELNSHEREKARALLFKVKEPVSELLVDYKRLATDGNGKISPMRQQRIKKLGELLFNLRERKHYKKRAAVPDES